MSVAKKGCRTWQEVGTRGEKEYACVNHLGNVLVTISDKKLGIDQNADNQADFYEAQVKSAQDYYPFGWNMPGRQLVSADYRYGFNGKENDKEWGNQLIQDYGFRLYNPAIGRFLSVDPLSPDYPWYTPYQFAGNKPIANIDLDGLEEEPYQSYNETLINGQTLIEITDADGDQFAEWRYSGNQYMLIDNRWEIVAEFETKGLNETRVLTNRAIVPTLSLVLSITGLGGAGLRPLSTGRIAYKAAVNANLSGALYVATKYKDGKAVHSMVGVKTTGDKGINWYHQIITGAHTESAGLIHGEGAIARSAGPNRSYSIVQVPISNEAATVAKYRAEGMIGSNTYNTVSQSCVTCGKDVMKAGGKTLPPTTLTPKQLENAALKQEGAKVVQKIKGASKPSSSAKTQTPTN